MKIKPHEKVKEILISKIYKNEDSCMPFGNEIAIQAIDDICISNDLFIISQKLEKFLNEYYPNHFDLLSTDDLIIEKFNSESYSGNHHYISNYSNWLELKTEMLEVNINDIPEIENLFDIEIKEPHLYANSIQINQIIIGTVFYVLMCYGSINKHLYELAITAIKRELHDVTLSKFSDEDQQIRIHELTILHTDLITISNKLMII